MGIPLTSPFGDHNESMIVKSISLGDDQVKTAERPVSFNGRDSDPKILKSLGSGRMAVEGSVRSDVMDNAAVKLQKVYKSFRTRRKLADCAVLVEQNWWEVIDFAELRHSSISFFDMEHHESAISRWSRAKTRAAKVGKGLSKNDKAQKLALQHWLEAIDPRHRYGHNLHFYYDKWFRSQSREPFFYWLDIGEGKEMNLEKCPRSKLLQQCIKYLGPIERLAYEVGVENGKLFFKQSGELLDTTTEPHSKWIFVLSTSKALYVGKKTKGTFQHSSFLAGGATSAAGRLVVENGDLKAVWPHSGHYRPTPENFQDFISFLRENNVDLSDVKMDPTDDDEEAFSKQRSSHHLRSNSSEEDFVQQIQPEKVSTEENAFASVHKVKPSPRMSKLIPSAQLTRLVLPRSADLVNKMKHENTSARVKLYTRQVESPRSKTSQGAGLDIGTENSESHQLDVSDYEEDSILKRINSHKEMKSYQLGKQLTCKWTSGTGPRISCVRDYPTELQFRALEQVNLSPRSLAQLKCTSSLQCGFNLSPKVPPPKTIFSEASVLPYRTRSSPLFEMTEVS